jgi:hypothetical protein
VRIVACASVLQDGHASMFAAIRNDGV